MAQTMTRTRARKPAVLRQHPLTFVPEGTDAGDLDALDPLFLDLQERRLATVRDLETWLHDWSELAAVLDEEESRRMIASTCHTDDEAILKRHLDFQQRIVPHTKPRFQALKTRLAESPLRAKLDRQRYAVLVRHVVNEIEIYRDDNVPLETRDAELVTQWQQVSGAMTVTLDGRELTLPMAAKRLDETDRARRETAWRAISERRLRDRDRIEGLYDEMVRVRHRIAENAGFRNYRDYAFRAKARFDYTPDDCRRYHDAVEDLVVPVLRRLHDDRRRRLGMDTLRPWDLQVDPDGRPPLRPFEAVEDLVAGVSDIFHHISPELGRLFESIRQRGNLDLDSRKGKAPGGYQCTLQVQRVPFIFMNAAGLHRDVMTLLHEGGHAFHALLSREDPLLAYRSAPLEFCEVASMGMEAIGLKHMDRFYPSREEADRARRDHFEGVIKLLPWIATIDAFQHAVYEKPGHSREERRAMWLDVRRRFKGGEDWSGLEEAAAHAWHAQMHPFCVPLYYIEYAIAQIGALQLWLHATKDRRKALAAYRRGLSLGGSRGLPALFKATGLKFGMDAKTLRPLVKAVVAEL